MADAGVGGDNFNDLRSEFMRAHHGMLVDPRNDVEALDRAGCPCIEKIRTARFLGDLLPAPHSVVLTLSSTQQTWG